MSDSRGESPVSSHSGAKSQDFVVGTVGFSVSLRDQGQPRRPQHTCMNGSLQEAFPFPKAMGSYNTRRQAAGKGKERLA